MRIALYAHRLAQRHPTGIGRYISELSAALPAAAREQDFVLASTREDEEPAKIPDGLELFRAPWSRRGVQLKWTLGRGPQIERALGEIGVIHLLQPFPPVDSDAPQVVTVHDLFPFEHPNWYTRSERWTYRRSIELLQERRASIVVPSRYIAGRVSGLLGIDPSEIAVVPLGLSGVFAAAPSEADEVVCASHGVSPGNYIVCLGAVSTRKNMITLVRAYAGAPPGLPVLLMIGPDGVGHRHIDAEIERLHVQQTVRRTGFLPDPEAAALVRQAAALVHPSLGEGFGLVPLEAMAAGTPVIAAATSSLPEVLGEAALLVQDPIDAQAWRAAMARVLGDPELQATLTAAGSQRAATFTWSATAKRMLEIYRATAA